MSQGEVLVEDWNSHFLLISNFQLAAYAGCLFIFTIVACCC